MQKTRGGMHPAMKSNVLRVYSEFVVVFIVFSERHRWLLAFLFWHHCYVQPSLRFYTHDLLPHQLFQLLLLNHCNKMPPQSSTSGGTKVAKGGVEKRKQSTVKFRKHPLAPKKPRSAFILFSKHMHNETKATAGNGQGGVIETVILVYQSRLTCLSEKSFAYHTSTAFFLPQRLLRTGASGSQESFCGVEKYVARRAEEMG